MNTKKNFIKKYNIYSSRLPQAFFRDGVTCVFRTPLALAVSVI